MLVVSSPLFTSFRERERERERETFPTNTGLLHPVAKPERHSHCVPALAGSWKVVPSALAVSQSDQVKDRGKVLPTGSLGKQGFGHTLDPGNELPAWKMATHAHRSRTAGDEVALLTAAAGLHCVWHLRARELKLSLQTSRFRPRLQSARSAMARLTPVCSERLPRHHDR